MTITLTPEQEKTVIELLNSGHFRSAEDVVAESIEMLRAQEEFIREHTEELRRKIAIGVEQIKRGEVLDGPEVFGRLLEKYRNRPRSGT